MSDWDAQPLGELLDEAKPGFACGEDPSDGMFQFRMNNITTEGQVDLTKKRRVPRETRNLDAYLLEPGDVLFNATNSPELVGKSAHVTALSEPAVFSNHFFRLRPSPQKLEGRFLARWLNSQFRRRVFQGMCRQWVNQATVNRESLLALRMPVPPLLEQRRIAEVLDRAEALRTRRRAVLALLDILAKSIFLDLFGDPLTNPKAWPTRAIRDVGTVVTGNTPSRARAEYYGDEIEWVKSDNLNTPLSIVTAAAERLSAVGRKVARTAPAGSILVTCIAGSPDCIGNSAIADRELAFNQQINAIIPRVENTLFLYGQVVVGKGLIQRASTSGMKGLVSKSRFEEIRLMWPPMRLQQEFARQMAVVEKLRDAQRASLFELDGLFASLQHRAFRGEL